MVNQNALAYGTLGEQYGNVPVEIVVKPPWHPRQRMKVNIVGVLVGFFVPWVLFNLLYADVGFKVHYKHTAWCWALVGIACVVVLGIGVAAALSLRGYLTGDANYNPSWIVFVFVTSVLAAVMGPMMGNNNFWANMEPYYNLLNLNDYVDVDPTRMRGQQMMDVGRANFVGNATVDLTKAYSFENLDTYCVAPITVYNAGLGHPTPLFAYDFWAVGLNCCKGNSTHTVDFRCGAYNNNHAHEGLRWMKDEERPFFRLAVQQAEAAHMISATHPLFFTWTTDALTELHKFQESAYKLYGAAVIGSFVVQLALVTAATYLFSKLGYYELTPHWGRQA